MRFSSEIGVCVLALVCIAHTASAQNLSRYRTFALGSSVATVAGDAALDASTARTLHQRPSVLQQIEWKLPQWTGATGRLSTDPVAQIAFSFLDDKLYQLVIDYRRERTEGMTDADVVAALSGEFGRPLARRLWRSGRPASRVEVEAGVAVARWEDSRHAVSLYRDSLKRPTFRLLVVDTQLSAQALAAEAQANRLDHGRAPEREVARLAKARLEERAAIDRLRTANLGAFRP